MSSSLCQADTKPSPLSIPIERVPLARQIQHISVTLVKTLHENLYAIIDEKTLDLNLLL